MRYPDDAYGDMLFPTGFRDLDTGAVTVVAVVGQVSLRSGDEAELLWLRPGREEVLCAETAVLSDRSLTVSLCLWLLRLAFSGFSRSPEGFSTDGFRVLSLQEFPDPVLVVVAVVVVMVGGGGMSGCLAEGGGGAGGFGTDCPDLSAVAWLFEDISTGFESEVEHPSSSACISLLKHRCCCCCRY